MPSVSVALAVSVTVAGAITSVCDSDSDTAGDLLSCCAVPEVTSISAVEVDAFLLSIAVALNL